MSKNIVICCDGTGNQYGRYNTNVVKVFEMLKSDEGQSIYYDPGVGTSSKALLRVFNVLSTAVSQAFGLDLQKNVEDAYYYLMNTYEPGDRIYLFGFSRGAHTVRRLSSMLEWVELLHKGSENMISYAARMYLNRDDLTEEEFEGFRKTFCRKCPVHFIGVWDTVSAVSRFLPRPKLDGVFSSEVRFAYHAVSIDEKRFNFPPSLWMKDTIADWQTVEEVWFAGVHSDVGGDYQDRELANIPLKWIAEKAVAAGIKVKDGSVEAIKINPLASKHESWSGIWLFMPFHLYVAIFYAAIWILESVANRILVEPVFPLFSYLTNWIVLLPLLVGMIFANRKIREIPKRSKVHTSVNKRIQSLNYQPINLKSVIEEIEWV